MTEQLPRSIDEYLKQLRRALAGADKALVQDALYDAEEYLRNELARHTDRTESELLAGIATTYGAPAEVADAYRQTEATVQAALRTPTPQRYSWLARFFGIMADPRAYTAVLFLLLALPTGILYFTWAIAGLALSAGFSVLIIGLPFFLLFVASVRLFSLVEGRTVEALLGVRMPRRPLHPGQAVPFLTRIVNMLADPRTWSALLYMLLKLPLGIVYFVVTIVGISVSIALVTAPILSLFGQAVFWDNGPIYLSWWNAPFSIAGGVLLLVLVMHLLRGLGSVQAAIARSLLVKEVESRPRPAADL